MSGFRQPVGQASRRVRSSGRGDRDLVQGAARRRRAGAGVNAEPAEVLGGFPFDPAPGEMRAMADAVAEALIAWIGGLEDAPANATEGAVGGCPATRRGAARGWHQGLQARARRCARRGAAHLRVLRPRVPRLHPGGRTLHGRARGVPRAGAEPLRRALAAEPGNRAARGERDALALRTVRVPRCDGAGCADDRRVAGEPLRRRDGAAHAAGRGLPRRHLLRDRSGARLEHEGGDDRRVRCAQRAPRAHRRRAADGPGRAVVDGGG